MKKATSYPDDLCGPQLWGLQIFGRFDIHNKDSNTHTSNGDNKNSNNYYHAVAAWPLSCIEARLKEWELGLLIGLLFSFAALSLPEALRTPRTGEVDLKSSYIFSI